MRIALRILASAAVVAFAPLGHVPARAADVIVGGQAGAYLPELEPLSVSSGAPAESTTSFFVSPSVNLNVGAFGFGMRYLFSSYELFEIDFDKHDVDLTVRYVANDYLQLIAGLRTELQRARSGADLDFDIFAFPVGVVLSYPLRTLGLTPYVSGIAYAYTSVDATSDGIGQHFDGFGGWAVEPGLAYSLYSLVDAPVGVSLSYRYQDIALDDRDASGEEVQFEERVQQVSLGVFYTFVEAF